MKRTLSKFLLLFACLFFFSYLNAQNITGIWQGYFITDDGYRYKLELQVEQSKKNGLSGVTYSYLTTVFYAKATATGLVKASTKNIIIQEIKTVELKMSGGSVACVMKYNLAYVKSGKEEFLKGDYTSKYEKSSYGAEKGNDCGGGTVFLKKVQISDFYVEPFLREKPVVRKTIPNTSKTTTTTSTKPVTKPPVNTAKTNTQKPSTPKTTPKKTDIKPQTTTVKNRKDTIQEKTKTTVVIEKPKVDKPRLTIPTVTRSRANDLAQTLVVTNEEIIIKLYDNGEIDNDTISVYLDGAAVLSHKRLSATPLKINLKMDEENAEHVLVMVAENLGSIPPNTSLMIVEDGDKRYEVRITSTEQKNAMVRFKYQSTK